MRRAALLFALALAGCVDGDLVAPGCEPITVHYVSFDPPTGTTVLDSVRVECGAHEPR